MTDRGISKYLSQSFREKGHSTEAQTARDARRQEHEQAMAAKRNKLEADRQAAAETANAQAQLDAGRQSGEGSPLKSEQRHANAGRGFGKYLNR